MVFHHNYSSHHFQSNWVFRNQMKSAISPLWIPLNRTKSLCFLLKYGELQPFPFPGMSACTGTSSSLMHSSRLEPWWLLGAWAPKKIALLFPVGKIGNLCSKPPVFDDVWWCLMMLLDLRSLWLLHRTFKSFNGWIQRKTYWKPRFCLFSFLPQKDRFPAAFR